MPLLLFSEFFDNMKQIEWVRDVVIMYILMNQDSDGVHIWAHLKDKSNIQSTPCASLR